MHALTRHALLILFSIFFFSNIGFSQKEKQPKFGKISMEQLKKTSHEKFPEAHAVVLFDYGTTTYEWYRGSGLQLVFERHVAIQFLDKEAFDHATFEIPLYRSGSLTERIAGVKGVTYNLDGKGKYTQTKLNKKDIFSEKKNKYTSIEKFTMPDVKEGSIIELRYSTNSDVFWYMQDWTFQDMIPTLYSQYEITVPEFLTFTKNFTGFISPEILPVSTSNRDGYQSRYEGWVMKNIPAFKDEKYMRSYSNYISKLDFELYSTQFPGSGTRNYIKTWDQVASNLMESSGFGGQLKKSGFIKDDIKTIANQYDTDEQKLVGIYEYIKTNIRWDSKYGEYAEKGIKKTYKEKTGNVADINLLLITALKEAGFNAFPIVMSTRSNGMLPLSYPSADKINYVIAGVDLDGKLMAMDATEDEFPMGLLPTRCFNGSGVLINGKSGKLINITPTGKYKSVIQNNIEISPDGTLSGKIKTSKSGYAALNFRRDLGKAGSEDKLVQQMIEENEGLSIESHNIGNAKNIYKPIKEEYDVTIEDKLEMTDDLIYINPMLFDAVTENPFKLEKREYPVDFAIPIEETYMLNLTVPDGYTVESMPEKSVVKLPEKACNFTYTASLNSGKITVTSRLKINKIVYTEAEYEYLKEFYNLMIQKHAEQIVLKKI